MAPVVVIRFSPFKLSCSGLIIRSKSDIPTSIKGCERYLLSNTNGITLDYALKDCDSLVIATGGVGAIGLAGGTGFLGFHIIKEAKKGCMILGICNGFQILIETNLLDGVLLKNNSLKFLHKVERGGASKSYWIEAARLAGVPKEVINNAKQILNKLEKNSSNNI